MAQRSQAVFQRAQQVLAGIPIQQVPHEAFKAMVAQAKTVVRTGEQTPYANVILRSGVTF
jgi:D-ribose pyranase